MTISLHKFLREFYQMLWVDAIDYKLDKLKDIMIVFFCKMHMFSMHIPYLIMTLYLSDIILEENHFILIDSQTSQNVV